MEELRQWYQTEVFAATDAQQQRWEERRWAFLGQLQHVLRRPLTHTVRCVVQQTGSHWLRKGVCIQC